VGGLRLDGKEASTPADAAASPGGRAAAPPLPQPGGAQESDLIIDFILGPSPGDGGGMMGGGGGGGLGVPAGLELLAADMKAEF
jgi:hypothetical protein